MKSYRCVGFRIVVVQLGLSTEQGWHGIYRRHIYRYPIFSSSKIRDIFDVFKIGYFPYFSTLLCYLM